MLISCGYIYMKTCIWFWSLLATFILRHIWCLSLLLHLYEDIYVMLISLGYTYRWLLTPKSLLWSFLIVDSYYFAMCCENISNVLDISRTMKTLGFRCQIICHLFLHGIQRQRLHYLLKEECELVYLICQFPSCLQVWCSFVCMYHPKHVGESGHPWFTWMLPVGTSDSPLDT